VIACCDAYNAMTTDRPYRKAMSRADALAELRACAGSQFDPDVVSIVTRIVEGWNGAMPATPAREADVLAVI
jgi:HD-GYP domain-containing protein (c-di-GMP phosphodiesterase class II)